MTTKAASAGRRQAGDETERRLNTLLANLAGMAYRCRNDPACTLEFVSEGCLALTGYRAEELQNNSAVACGDLIHPADQQRVWEEVQAGVAARLPYDLRYRIRTAGGEEKWVMERGCGVFDTADELVALEGFISDITELIRAEEALQQANLLLSQQLEER